MMNTALMSVFYVYRYLYANLRGLMEKQSGLLWRDLRRTSPPTNWTTSSKKGETVLVTHSTWEGIVELI